MRSTLAIFGDWLLERRYQHDVRWRAQLLDGLSAEAPIKAAVVTDEEMQWNLGQNLSLVFDRKNVRFQLLRYCGSADVPHYEPQHPQRLAMILADTRVDTAEAFAEYQANVDAARAAQREAKAKAEAADLPVLA